MNRPPDTSGIPPDAPQATFDQELWDYCVDAIERGILFLDVLERRSEQYKVHAAKLAPHVSKFACELVMDGRKLERPVNYLLAGVLSPEGVKTDNKKRPFIIVDPRAGHGPGIGGSSRTARSAWPSRQAIPVTSSVFCPFRSLARQLKTLPTRKRASSGT